MITNLPPPGGVSPVVSSDTTATQDSFSYDDEYPQGYPNYPNQPYQQQYYPHQQQPQQYPTPQVPHWHHQHGYYNPYPQQQQTYPSYSPSDPNGYYPQSNGYYDHNNGVHTQSAQTCTPSPLANSDDSGEGCINESKGSLRGGLLPLIPRPKGPKPTTSVMSAKRGGKRARQRDPNEPQKPVSAYALFFRDVQAGIKARNPAASFGEVSKHVAALWDGMDPDSKGAYKRRTEQAKKEYLRQLAAYRATLVSKGNTLESPYNGKGLDVKVGEDRTYLMNPRMNESSGYGSNNSSGNSLTPLGSAPTPVSTSPQATLGQSPNNGYQQQQHHMRPQMPPDARFPGGFVPTDPYSQHSDPTADPSNPSSAGQLMVSHCKRPGCPNPVRMISSNRPMPEYCSNDCLVSESNKSLTNNPYSNATQNWQQETKPADSEK